MDGGSVSHFPLLFNEQYMPLRRNSVVTELLSPSGLHGALLKKKSPRKMFGVDCDSADLGRDTGWYRYIFVFERLRGSSLGGKGYRLVWRLLLLSEQHFPCVVCGLERCS